MAAQQKQAENSEKIRGDRAMLLDGAPPKQKREFGYFNRINLMRAETFVIRQIIDCRLIKYAVQMIEAEHSALEAAFEQAASEQLVQAYVHPQQQFASTMFQQVDRNAHLDVVSKLGFVQQFLTRLRNRCTEVETLTSGPGIVFSVSTT